MTGEQVSRIIHEGNKTDYSLVFKHISGPADDRTEITVRADTIEEFQQKLQAVKDGIKKETTK